MNSFNAPPPPPAPDDKQEDKTNDLYNFEKRVKESKELAYTLLNDLSVVENVTTILGGNGLSINKDVTAPGNPTIKLNKIDFSEPTAEENQAVEALANFLGRTQNVITRFPNQTYAYKGEGHRLELLYNKGFNTNAKDLLEEVKVLLNTAIEHDFGA